MVALIRSPKWSLVQLIFFEKISWIKILSLNIVRFQKLVSDKKTKYAIIILGLNYSS